MKKEVIGEAKPKTKITKKTEKQQAEYKKSLSGVKYDEYLDKEEKISKKAPTKKQKQKTMKNKAKEMPKENISPEVKRKLFNLEVSTNTLIKESRNSRDLKEKYAEEIENVKKNLSRKITDITNDMQSIEESLRSKYEIAVKKVEELYNKEKQLDEADYNYNGVGLINPNAEKTEKIKEKLDEMNSFSPHAKEIIELIKDKDNADNAYSNNTKEEYWAKREILENAIKESIAIYKEKFKKYNIEISQYTTEIIESMKENELDILKSMKPGEYETDEEVKAEYSMLITRSEKKYGVREKFTDYETLEKMKNESVLALDRLKTAKENISVVITSIKKDLIEIVENFEFKSPEEQEKSAIDYETYRKTLNGCIQEKVEPLNEVLENNRIEKETKQKQLIDEKNKVNSEREKAEFENYRAAERIKVALKEKEQREKEAQEKARLYRSTMTAIGDGIMEEEEKTKTFQKFEEYKKTKAKANTFSDKLAGFVNDGISQNSGNIEDEKDKTIKKDNKEIVQ